VPLTQRISKLEKKVAGWSQTGTLEGKVVYQPSDADLAEALAILLECGAVRIINWETTDIARR
jgi:hypothetical protein